VGDRAAAQTLLGGAKRPAAEGGQPLGLGQGPGQHLVRRGHLVDVAGGQRLVGGVDVSQESGAGQRGGQQAIAGQLHRQHRHRQPDGDLVQADAIGACGGHPDVTGQHHQRAAGQGVAGARDDQRDRRAVETHEQVGAAHQERPGGVGAAHHDAEVEPGAEAVGPAGQHHRRGLALGPAQRGDQRGDHRLRQRVGLAVVHLDDGGLPLEAIADQVAHGPTLRPIGDRGRVGDPAARGAGSRPLADVRVRDRHRRRRRWPRGDDGGEGRGAAAAAGELRLAELAQGTRGRRGGTRGLGHRGLQEE
jgi:hypothetical protein